MPDIRNPLTSAVDDVYTDEELRFLKAIDRYKKRERRPFPSWRELLNIVHSLGYRRVAEAAELPRFKRGL